MGFFGMFTGGQRKKQAQRGVADIRKTRAGIGTLREGIEAYRTAPRPDVDLQRSQYRGMIEDPNLRGFSPETVNKMYGTQAEAITGARKSTMRDIGRQYAAQGMGNTGQGVRAAMALAPQYAGQFRGARRDVDIANEQLKRSELWQALAGIGELQRGEDVFNLSAFGQQGGLYGTEIGTYMPELALQKQAYDSRWGPALAELAGQAIQGFGYGLGSRPPATKKSGG